MKENYSLCFVMPAYQRFALSEITFAQRRIVCEYLNQQGIKADCVVIADDENLEIARENNLRTIERNNEFLGARFNDGHEFAWKSKFDFSVPVGSDMFIDPELFVGLIDQFTTSNYYTVVKSNGRQMLNIWLDWGILQMIPRRYLDPLKGRPCAEIITRGCDSSTRNRVKNNNGRQLDISYKNLHTYECISFQSKTQITNFEKLADLENTNRIIGEPELLIDELKKYYPGELLDAVLDYYVKGISALY